MNGVRTWPRLGAATSIGLLLFMLFGLLVATYPSLTGIALLIGTTWLVVQVQASRMGLETWQTITLLALTGFVVLNYGFENLSVPLGPSLPAGELLMAAALALAVLRYRGFVFHKTLRDPLFLCILALLLLTLIHLTADLPNYGLYALRDSTSSFEALFVLLGVLWAAKEPSPVPLLKWLLFLFMVSTLYSYTFPWAEQLQAWSPTSGPFHPVALIGNYQDISVFLLSGALFCVWVAPYFVHWPSWALRLLAIVQLAGLGVLQSRTMYVGIALVLLLLVVLRETKPMSQFLSVLAPALGALVLTMVLLSAWGWKVQGRLGTMDLPSLTKEIKSIWPSSAASQELGHESDRRAWYGEVWDKARSSPMRFLVGVGYGQPLIDFLSDTGQPIRQPHNSTLNVFGRLGLLGLSTWVLFVCLLLKRLWRGVREAKWMGGVYSPLCLWLLAFAMLGLLDSLVQPYFEFSHSAVPFFFLVGVALGIDPKKFLERSVPAPVRSGFSRVRDEDDLRALPWQTERS